METRAQVTDSFEDNKRIIRELGLKVTQQRLTILNEIISGRSHFTAQSIFENIAKHFPEIGFATVYRFLRQLSQNGFVTEVRMGGLPARYEWANKSHHDHLTCISCGTIQEFENREIETLQERIASEFGFTLTDHILELFGQCRKCQAQSDKLPSRVTFSPQSKMDL
jgi:Fur family ferric uptake transcriptional regulator